MAKQITHVSVFLASPSDLSEERVAVKQVINELNTLVRQTMNIHLDLLTWETDAYPSAGIDAQDVINEQIGNDYDIFIGMMWKKFGTPTGRAGSGTEEEFERAYNRFLETNGQTKIMLYFSSKSIPPDEINLEQLGKVRDFKVRAQKLGILHWSFNDNESFQKMLKMHLTRHLSDIVDFSKNNPNKDQYNPDNKAKTNINNTNNIKIDDLEDEYGYFDLMEIFTDNFSQVEKILVKMGEHLEELGQQMSRKASKIDTLNKSPNRSANSYRILIDSSAADINNYVDLTAIELPRFQDLFTTGIDAFSNALTLSEASGGEININELEELLQGISSAKVNVEFASNSMIGFREKIIDIPPVAKSINRAIRLLRNTLSNVIEAFDNSMMLLDELHEVIHSIIDRNKDKGTGATEI